MGDIYTEQGITKTPTVNIGDMSTGAEVRQGAKIFDAMERQAAEKAEQHQKLANHLYENGSNLAIHSGLEQLSNDPAFASNPEAFAKEADKMASQVYGEIQNPEIKANVILNYEMKKNSYINKAQGNLYRQQTEQQQYQAMQDVDGYMSDIARSLGNLMSKNYSVDDYMTLRDSIAGVNNVLNQKDMKGFNLLSPSEKRAVERAQNTLLQNTVIHSIESAPFEERLAIVDAIADDKFEMINGLKDTMNRQEATVGGLDSYLKPESVQYIKDYARGVQERYKKLRTTDKNDTGYSDRQALEKASTQTVYDKELPKELEEINKIKEPDDRVYGYLSERLRAIELYKNKDIDIGTFNKIMGDSVAPLTKDISEIDSKYQHWYKPNGAFRDGVDVVNTLGDLTKEEKAYLYTNLFDAMAKDNIELDSTDGSDKKRAKDIALAIKQEYLEDKNANLVGTNVNRVLLGTDVIEAYKPNKEPKIATPKWKIWEKNDGTRYKVLPDKNGEYTNESVFIRIGG